jgi:CubicO group peptidase (beta-lactamase class C family)
MPSLDRLRSSDHRSSPSLSRRGALGLGLGLAGTALVPRIGSGLAFQDDATPEAGIDTQQIVDLVDEAMASYALRAAIVRVDVDGQEVVTIARGESLPGQPASADMHFRNGAVAFSYLAMLLLTMVDDGAVGLDDSLATWMPDLPDAEAVTLRMLANMTAGYPDYVQNATFITNFYADPFRQYTPEELIAIGLSTPRMFEAGTNWDYSHTNYVILGRALEAIAGQPMRNLMRERVLDPLGLHDTEGWLTPEIPEPVLHAYSSERRGVLGIDPDVPFLEESTFWNPSWTTAEGAVQTTTIADMAESATAIGTGALLSDESYHAMVDPVLMGFGEPLEGCPTCHTLEEEYVYGLGIVRRGAWLIQNPLFGGYGGVAAYLPSQAVSIAVVATATEASFDAEGEYRFGNAAQRIFESLSAELAGDSGTPAPA